MIIPRVIIAGTQSGVGKTTIATGIMGALKKWGYTVQGFKVGPDYIDPSYHNIVTGRLSENLDTWLAPQNHIREVFAQATKGADIAVIEGVMGLYDGLSGLDETGSTSQIAKILNCPVLLVIDAYNTVRSSAATALGFQTFDPDVKIRGVILNNVAGEVHANWCKDAIEAKTGLPVVGWLPVNKKISLPERHLGLIPTPEKQQTQIYREITEFIQERININLVYDIAKSAGQLPSLEEKRADHPRKQKNRVKIGVAFDEAFNFYYPSNLNLLSQCGAEIIRFSPIHDGALPENLGGLYIGGGFPEMFLKQLETNQAMRKAILHAANSGMPVFAECAGLMYLTKAVADFDGQIYQMTGVLDGVTVMTSNTLVTYSQAQVISSNILSHPPATINGHEFHNSVITDIPADAKFAYQMLMGEGIKGKKEGWIKNNVLASYMHIQFAQDKSLAENFVGKCLDFRRHKKKSG
jgi:cobyrinic acid a,c-diamide synthase